MILPWRDVSIGDGPSIPTSLTESEIAALRGLVLGKRVLEIGSAYGFSAISMALAGAESVLAVDPHGGYGAMPGSLARMVGFLSFYDVDDRVKISIGRSQDILPILSHQGWRFDVIFVDGDHTASTVEHDIRWALDLLSDGGVLACHDYGEDTCPDVRTVIDDLVVEGLFRGNVSRIDTLWVNR